MNERGRMDLQSQRCKQPMKKCHITTFTSLDRPGMSIESQIQVQGTHAEPILAAVQQQHHERYSHHSGITVIPATAHTSASVLSLLVRVTWCYRWSNGRQCKPTPIPATHMSGYSSSNVILASLFFFLLLFSAQRTPI